MTDPTEGSPLSNGEPVGPATFGDHATEVFGDESRATDAPLETWPYRGAGFGLLILAAVVMAALLSAAGFLVTTYLQPSSIGEAEIGVNRWLEDNRTDRWTSVAELASVPADTFVVFGVVLAGTILVPRLLGSWRQWALVLTALALQLSAVMSASLIIERDRPPVEQLTTPPTGSWPSGHVAAAIVLYGSLAVLARRHCDDSTVRRWAPASAVVVVAGVALSRLYLGAHYVSDIVASIIVGLAVLWMADAVVGSRSPSDDPA